MAVLAHPCAIRETKGLLGSDARVPMAVVRVRASTDSYGSLRLFADQLRWLSSPNSGCISN